MRKGIIWSYTKGEFVIFDHYYFSKLYKYINTNYNLFIPTKFSSLLKAANNDNFNMIVFNYPEKPFTQNQIKSIINLFKNGKTILFLTYYKNEDNSSKIANSVLKNFGLSIRYDEITQKENIHDNDKYLVITSKIASNLKENVNKVIMPCASSIEIKEKKGMEYKILLSSEEDNKVIAAEAKGKGRIIAFGTCVFWDNFSISMYDNLQFTKNLINYCMEG